MTCIDDIIEFGGLGSSYSTLYKLKPGGYSTVAALEIDRPHPCTLAPPAPPARSSCSLDPLLESSPRALPAPTTTDRSLHSPPLVSSPSALLTPAFTTDTCEIAAILDRTWSSQFAHKPVESEGFDSFFSHVRSQLACSLLDLTPGLDDIEIAISRTKDSGLGPDGVPYSAYKAAGKVGVVLVALLIQYIFHSPNELDQHLLLAFMVFLPKKSFGYTPSGLKLYRASNLRPLSLSNTLIKLVSLCLRVKLCRIADPCIHIAQKCITGRNLLNNVVQVDTAMHNIAIRQCAHPELNHGCAIFFDFSAAFVSIAHDFLWRYLAHTGIPLPFVSGLRKMYTNNQHFIKLGGRVFNGPTLYSGVRQGCPLSMILFAICVDPLIRQIADCLDTEIDEVVAAFADDIGLVLADITRTLPRILALFQSFGNLCGLKLNLSKCCVVSLADSPIKQTFFTTCFRLLAPAWADFSFKDHAEYLGFMLGPGGADTVWDAVIRKADDTILRWSQLGLGFNFNVLACNIYVLSLFQYIGQLAACNDKVTGLLKRMESRLFRGPGNWIPTGFLVSLKLIGFHVELRDLGATLLASKVRVANHSCLDTMHLRHDLCLAVNAFRTTYPDHHHVHWHSHAFLLNLVLANHNFRVDCLKDNDISSLCAVGEQQALKSQKKIYAALCSQNLPTKRWRMIEGLRKRMSRFDFGIPIGHAVNRASNRLNLAKGKVKPAVIATYVKTLLNAWPTSRRMRTLHRNPVSLCPFCREGDDSIEHFVRCSFCHNVFHLSGADICVRQPCLSFFALDTACLHLPILVKRLKALAILFHLRQTIAHHPPEAPPLDLSALVRSAFTLRH